MTRAFGPVSVTPSPSADFKPTRRVRELPGGPRTNIFADEEVPDALSKAPPRVAAAPPSTTTASVSAADPPAAEAPAAVEDEGKNEGNVSSGTGIKPSRCESVNAPLQYMNSPRFRRVREAPGGNSSLNSFWGADEPEEFKPTRR